MKEREAGLARLKRVSRTKGQHSHVIDRSFRSNRNGRSQEYKSLEAEGQKRGPQANVNEFGPV